MGVLTRVGRKGPIARLGLGCLYLVLLIGAVTTLFPFLIMVSTGLTGPTNQNENSLIPSYLTNDPKLLEKYVVDKNSGDLDRLASTRTGESHQAQDFGTFLESLPPELFEAGFRQPAAEVTSRLNVQYQAWLHSKFADIRTLIGLMLKKPRALKWSNRPVSNSLALLEAASESQIGGLDRI